MCLRLAVSFGVVVNSNVLYELWLGLGLGRVSVFGLRPGLEAVAKSCSLFWGL